MELRVHDEADAITTPTGNIPYYHDLQRLFREVLGREYTSAEYETQFAFRVKENLAKLERIENVYKTKISDTPNIVFEALGAQRARIIEAQKKFGLCISPRILAQR